MHHFFNARYVIGALPGFLLLVAIGVATIVRYRIAAIVAAALLVRPGWDAAMTEPFRKLNWRAIAETIAAQAQEEDARKQWDERLLLLREEKEIRVLEAAVARWHELRGSPLRTLHELVAAGWLREVPREPHGTTYLVDEGGSVHPTIVYRLLIFGGTAMQSGLEVH
jgi:hypothetical protein